MHTWKPYAGVRRVNREMPPMKPLPDYMEIGPWIVYHELRKGKRYWVFSDAMEYVTKDRAGAHIITNKETLVACVNLIATVYAGHQSITIEKLHRIRTTKGDPT